MKSHITEFTETEFLEIARKIYFAEYASDKAHIKAVMEFARLSEHPGKADLFYYPEAGKDGPEAVVAEVKAWRAANGKPGFKTE